MKARTSPGLVVVLALAGARSGPATRRSSVASPTCSRIDPPRAATLWLSSDVLELRDEGRTIVSLTRECPGARCLDLDALERAFGEPLRARSDPSLALRIDRDVPYETVVALLSWIRGHAWDPIVDTNPPLSAPRDRPRIRPVHGPIGAEDHPIPKPNQHDRRVAMPDGSNVLAVFRRNRGSW